MGGKKDKLCSEGVHAPVCMCVGARGKPQVLFLKPYLLLGPNIFLGGRSKKAQCQRLRHWELGRRLMADSFIKQRGRGKEGIL